jgi:hypothetical protein
MVAYLVVLSGKECRMKQRDTPVSLSAVSACSRLSLTPAKSIERPKLDKVRSYCCKAARLVISVRIVL